MEYLLFINVAVIVSTRTNTKACHSCTIRPLKYWHDKFMPTVKNNFTRVHAEFEFEESLNIKGTPEHFQEVSNTTSLARRLSAYTLYFKCYEGITPDIYKTILSIRIRIFW